MSYGAIALMNFMAFVMGMFCYLINTSSTPGHFNLFFSGVNAGLMALNFLRWIKESDSQ